MDDVQTRSARPPMAPRHLKRRRLLPEIPDGRFVKNGVQDASNGTAAVDTRPSRVTRQPTEPRRKRMIALVLVIAVTLTIPALVLALVFLS